VATMPLATAGGTRAFARRDRTLWRPTISCMRRWRTFGNSPVASTWRLLANMGIAAALDTQARRVPIPVSVEAGGIGRYTQEPRPPSTSAPWRPCATPRSTQMPPAPVFAWKTTASWKAGRDWCLHQVGRTVV